VSYSQGTKSAHPSFRFLPLERRTCWCFVSILKNESCQELQEDAYCGQRGESRDEQGDEAAAEGFAKTMGVSRSETPGDVSEIHV
jgi:hypothetical protein